MKTLVISLLLTGGAATLAQAQTTTGSTPVQRSTVARPIQTPAAARQLQKAPTFTSQEQEKIKQLLGNEYVPVFSSQGELAIATKTSVSKVRALPGGGFSKGPGSVASNILIHSGWVLATSQEMLEAMKSRLGAERFQQLDALMRAKQNSIR